MQRRGQMSLNEKGLVLLVRGSLLRTTPTM